MNQCLDMFPLPIPEVVPNAKGAISSVRPAQGAQSASCGDFASVLSAESAATLADNISSVSSETTNLSKIALALLGQQPPMAAGKQMTISSKGAVDAVSPNAICNQDACQLDGELLLSVSTQNLQTGQSGAGDTIQTDPITGQTILPQMIDPALLTLATLQPQMTNAVDGEPSQTNMTDFLPLVFVPNDQGDAQVLLIPKAELKGSQTSSDAITAYLLQDSSATGGAVSSNIAQTAVSSELLIPVSLNLTQSQAEKLAALAQDSDTKMATVLPQPETIATKHNGVAQAALTALTTNSGQAQALDALLSGANVESMTVQLTVDPEKLVQWLESQTKVATKSQGSSAVTTTQAVNANDPTDELLSPVTDAAPKKETDLQDILSEPDSKRSHPDLVTNLQKEISSNTGLPKETIHNLSDSLSVSASAAGNQHVVNNAARVAVPTPVASPAAFEVPESARFQVSFDRMQIESLLKQGEIKLKLNPPELGHMKVELISTSDHVSAKFEITSEAAKRVVEYHLPQLRENLARAGIRVDQVEVVIHNDAQERQQPRYSDPQPQSQRAIVYDDSESETETIATPDLRVIAGGLNLLV